jgi:D-glycero-alpha-D-manno-heptose-7-phosphate kinase
VSRGVTVQVPVRVCDVGGWTDTWFAGHGRVCSLAVEPGVSVEAAVAPGDGRVEVEAVDFGVTFTVGVEPDAHRLLADAVREAGDVGPSDVHLRVSAAVPPSSSFGTSASVCVGLIAALDAVRGAIRPPDALAAAAHRAEVDRYGRQCGVQDQLAAAHGGANLIEIVDYPRSATRPLALSTHVAAALDERLVHVAYGSAHDSSAVHQEVIGSLTDEGPSSPRLERVRLLADRAAHALVAGDLDGYGAVLTAATDAQAALHAALISDAAVELIDLARTSGATGWKVNGAGGGGGSISVLAATPAQRDHLAAEAARLGHTPVPLSLAAHGARDRMPP